MGIQEVQGQQGGTPAISEKGENRESERVSGKLFAEPEKSGSGSARQHI